MPSLVQRLIELPGVCAMPLWWNYDGYARRFPRFDHPLIGIVRLIGQQRLRFQPGQERIRPGQIMHLASGQNDLQRIAQSIRQHVEFTAQTAFASPDRLIFPDFFWAPALC